VPFETIIEEGKARRYDGDLPPSDYDRTPVGSIPSRGRQTVKTPQAA
jgi:hypothetical protein